MNEPLFEQIARAEAHVTTGEYEAASTLLAGISDNIPPADPLLRSRYHGVRYELFRATGSDREATDAIREVVDACREMLVDERHEALVPFAENATILFDRTKHSDLAGAGALLEEVIAQLQAAGTGEHLLARAFLGRAMVLAFSDRLAEAKEPLDAARSRFVQAGFVENVEPIAFCHALAGELHARSGERQQAIEQFDIAFKIRDLHELEADLDHIRFRLLYAGELEANGDLVEAMLAYDEALNEMMTCGEPMPGSFESAKANFFRLKAATGTKW